MSFVLTLVASQENTPLKEKHFKALTNVLGHYNIEYTSNTVWLSKNKAGERGINNGAQTALVSHLRDELAKDKIDFFITLNENRQKKLLLADMDSTIVEGETLDEMAEHVGLKDKIAEITTRAMNGELDFHSAIRERVSLLKDLPIEAVQDTINQTKLNKGAKTFIQTMKKAQSTCVLVSGGFTVFTEEIAQQCGFDHHHGNTLNIEDEKLTGSVREPILDKHAKVNFLQNYCAELEITPKDCLTIGDGANDLPMLKMAGLGIGYHPKDAVSSEMHNCILYGDLTTALYAQGYSEDYFEEKSK